jgi:AraC family transcriptional regulator, regulatory protein of adaptative response / methylated-DNA-[protein]-cysteine methyltransferase
MARRISRKKRVGITTDGRKSIRMNDYERIARVIRYMDEHSTAQPRLSVLADVAGMSEFHFHRLFSTWAGTTPKHFLQCLTFERARDLLAQGHGVLQSALESGLSGPGRLHDLCVNLEAASPGEIKSGGAGWTIQAGFGDSPFGRCIIAQSHRGICYIFFVDEDESAAWDEMTHYWPKANWVRSDKTASKLLQTIFHQPNSPAVPRRLTAFVKGTEFQVRVWRALLRIPSGSLTSYSRLASEIGQPTATRAVGSAVGANPIGWLIPCHRVIRETGAFGGYRGGLVRKRAMLSYEGVAGQNGVIK